MILSKNTNKNIVKIMQKMFAMFLCLAALLMLLPINVFAYGNSTTYYESSTNTQSTPDLIPIGYGSGDEHHMFGTISSSSDSDWYAFKPLRHGRVFVMVLCSGIFYNVDVYKGNTSTEIYSNTYTTYDCIADISFMVTRDSVNSSNMPTYYINVSSYDGSFNALKNYRIIVFYAIYGHPGSDSTFTFPLPLSGATQDLNLKITSSVGKRTYDNKYHIGTDFKSSYGTTIYSVDDAYVHTSEKHASYGNRVFLILESVDPYDTDNNINARYYHLSSRSVTRGTNISKGDIVGAVGWDGLANIDFTHLHIDFNSLPATSTSRFTQSYFESNPAYLINIVDLFPDLEYWADNSNYVYINS